MLFEVLEETGVENGSPNTSDIDIERPFGRVDALSLAGVVVGLVCDDSAPSGSLSVTGYF